MNQLNILIINVTDGNALGSVPPTIPVSPQPKCTKFLLDTWCNIWFCDYIRKAKKPNY